MAGQAIEGKPSHPGEQELFSHLATLHLWIYELVLSLEFVPVAKCNSCDLSCAKNHKEIAVSGAFLMPVRSLDEK